MCEIVIRSVELPSKNAVLVYTSFSDVLAYLFPNIYADH